MVLVVPSIEVKPAITLDHEGCSLLSKVARGCILDRRATELLVQALVALKKYAEVKEFWGRCYNAPGVRFFNLSR